MRLYAREQHDHLQGKNAQRRADSFFFRPHLGMLRTDRSAPPLLSSSEGWDGFHSPVDVVQLPESRPGQTRVLLPSRTLLRPSEIKDSPSLTRVKSLKSPNHFYFFIFLKNLLTWYITFKLLLYRKFRSLNCSNALESLIIQFF